MASDVATGLGLYMYVLAFDSAARSATLLLLRNVRRGFSCKNAVVEQAPPSNACVKEQRITVPLRSP